MYTPLPANLKETTDKWLHSQFLADDTVKTNQNFYSDKAHDLDDISVRLLKISCHRHYILEMNFQQILIPDQFQCMDEKRPLLFKSSRSQMFFKIVVLKMFVNFTGKHLCWRLFLLKFQASCNRIKKRLQHRCFPVKFAKFFKTPFYRIPTVAATVVPVPEK